MKTLLALLGLVVFFFLTVTVQAEANASPENNLDEIRKLCAHDKKPKNVCGCLVRNIRTKFHNGQFGEKQLGDAVLAARHLPDAPDYVADLMTGIEYHCMENSNYSD